MELFEISNNFAQSVVCATVLGQCLEHLGYITLTIYLENGKDAHHFFIKWISISSESTVDKKFLAAALF